MIIYDLWLYMIIKLFKSDSKYIYNVTKDLYLKRIQSSDMKL